MWEIIFFTILLIPNISIIQNDVKMTREQSNRGLKAAENVNLSSH